ncbi:MAG: isopentenyl pyrophosphate isomerase [Piptocephalis tieghemiana]|nr:MAG: isopentenyl pyrophosphate isomerase [Piptocephalis tieghemiana]
MVPDLQQYDAEQARLMEERCILLDEDDKVIGAESKKNCHLMELIDSKNLLHRAFSVFIFSPTTKKLLLQQRSSDKITFPMAFTNTCCSHPLDIPTENTADPVEGVRVAAQRKLEQELGIPLDQVAPATFNYLTRIHYKAPSDGLWGEHEIDYILFHLGEPDLNVNPNEVESIRWVSQDDLRDMIAQSELILTPWFRMIADTFLFKWWDQLDNLDNLYDPKTIHRF